MARKNQNKQNQQNNQQNQRTYAEATKKNQQTGEFDNSNSQPEPNKNQQ